MPADIRHPEAPPEARLIRRLREQAPKMSRYEAAATAGISEARWRMIETGVRWFRGEPLPEPPAPAQTVARMAWAVGATAGQLTEAGRDDAAAELEAIAAQVEQSGNFSGRQAKALAKRVRRDSADGSSR